jgi:hypothetical protein
MADPAVMVLAVPFYARNSGIQYFYDDLSRMRLRTGN